MLWISWIISTLLRWQSFISWETMLPTSRFPIFFFMLMDNRLPSFLWFINTYLDKVSTIQILYTFIHICDGFEFSSLKINGPTDLSSRVEIRKNAWQTKWPLQSQIIIIFFNQREVIQIYHLTLTSWIYFHGIVCFSLPKEKFKQCHFGLCSGVEDGVGGGSGVGGVGTGIWGSSPWSVERCTLAGSSVSKRLLWEVEHGLEARIF